MTRSIGESCRRFVVQKKPNKRVSTRCDIIHLKKVQGQVKLTDGDGSQYNDYLGLGADGVVTGKPSGNVP